MRYFYYDFQAHPATAIPRANRHTKIVAIVIGVGLGAGGVIPNLWVSSIAGLPLEKIGDEILKFQRFDLLILKLLFGIAHNRASTMADVDIDCRSDKIVGGNHELAPFCRIFPQVKSCDQNFCFKNKYID